MERSQHSLRPNPVTVSAEVVGSSIGRLSHHRMMPADVCDGLGLDRCPWDGHTITILLKQSRPPASGLVDKSNGKAVTVTQCSDAALRPLIFSFFLSFLGIYILWTRAQCLLDTCGL